MKKLFTYLTLILLGFQWMSGVLYAEESYTAEFSVVEAYPFWCGTFNEKSYPSTPIIIWLELEDGSVVEVEFFRWMPGIVSLPSPIQSAYSFAPEGYDVSVYVDGGQFVSVVFDEYCKDFIVTYEPGTHGTFAPETYVDSIPRSWNSRDEHRIASNMPFQWELTSDLGWTFDGWEVQWERLFRVLEENWVITALWISTDYTITIDSNGGWMVSNPADYTVSDLIQNRTLTTPASPIGFTISFDTNGGGANPGNVISTRPFSTWTITTNSIPESSIVGNVLNITENAMGDIEIRADWWAQPSVTCAVAPTKEGYTFNGWYTAPTEGTKRCDANGNYIPDSSETLYAQRTPVTKPGGGGKRPDYCPDGDFSPSRYDRTCGEPPVDPEENKDNENNGHDSATDEDPENYTQDEEENNLPLEYLLPPPLSAGITRAEMAKLVSIYSYNHPEKKPDHTKYQCKLYTDLDTAPEDLRDYVITACELGLMGYYSDGITYKPEFSPNEVITKAEVVTVLSRMLRENKYAGTEEFRYHSHILAIYKAGVIENQDNPFMKETRGNVIMMMKRL